MSRVREVRRALFPGDRRVWLVAAGLGSLILLGIAIAVLVPRDHYTGTNGVRLRSIAVELGRNIGKADLCAPGQEIPAGTGRVEIQVETPGPRPPIDLAIRTADGRVLKGRELTPPATGRQKVQFAIPEVESNLPGASVCLHVRGDRVFVGGVADRTEFDLPLIVAGEPVDSRIALWYRPPPGEKHSVVSLLPDMWERAALFRPGWVGPWTYAVLLFLVFPGLIYAGLRLLARADEERRRRVPLAVLIGAIAFGHAVVWAHVNPPFNAPDETEHYAYVQKLGETGKGLTNSPRLYSSAQSRAVGVIRILSASETGDGRTTWLKSQEREFEERREADPLPLDDGGGVATATSSHSPLYYSTLVPAYTLTKGDTAFTTLTWARVSSALYGAIVAAFAFLLVLELFPRWRPLAVAAGLMVAFHPMFAFMSGSVNNDMGVNAAAAVLLYLTIRAMTRGLTPWLGVAIGAVLVIAPLMKGTAYALYPAVALGLAYVLWRGRSRREVVSVAAVLGVGVLLFLGWTEMSGYFDRSTFTTPGGEAPGSNFPARENPRGTLAYLWQIFFPPVGMVDYWNYPGGWPFFDVYVVRGFGSFGWYAMTFADWVYWAIVVVMGAVAVMALAALWRHRDNLRTIAPRAIVLLVAVVVLIAGVHAFYFPNAPRSPPFPEQGRYAFPLIAAFAAFVAASAFAFGRRHVVPVATGFTVAVMGLAYAAQFLALSRFFS